jgi:hypothetical protein
MCSISHHKTLWFYTSHLPKLSTMRWVHLLAMVLVSCARTFSCATYHAKHFCGTICHIHEIFHLLELQSFATFPHFTHMKVMFYVVYHTNFNFMWYITLHEVFSLFAKANTFEILKSFTLIFPSSLLYHTKLVFMWYELYYMNILFMQYALHHMKINLIWYTKFSKFCLATF